MPQKTDMKYPTSGRDREDGCHKRQKYNTEHRQREGGWMPQRTEIRYQKFHIQQWQREGGWMPHKTEMKYPTVAEGGWMPQKTEMEHPAVAEGGRMDATKHRNNISNNGTGRENGCQKS